MCAGAGKAPVAGRVVGVLATVQRTCAVAANHSVSISAENCAIKLAVGAHHIKLTVGAHACTAAAAQATPSDGPAGGQRTSVLFVYSPHLCGRSCALFGILSLIPNTILSGRV